AALDVLKKVMECDNVDAIKAATEKLTQAAYAISAALYSQPGAEASGAEAGAGAGAGASKGAADDTIVDADYEEVK
ncbi:MAG: molecular chaperone DnaK, partial [Candidatus Sericytochromatia bacterium]|nr:molecular chaperone DnaK [Candidatus Sericytochromatia bacterium]